MALPRKGSRVVTVGGLVFRWKTLASDLGGRILIEHPEEGIAKLEAQWELAVPIGPRAVSRAIVFALASGWRQAAGRFRIEHAGDGFRLAGKPRPVVKRFAAAPAPGTSRELVFSRLAAAVERSFPDRSEEMLLAVGTALFWRERVPIVAVFEARGSHCAFCQRGEKQAWRLQQVGAWHRETRFFTMCVPCAGWAARLLVAAPRRGDRLLADCTRAVSATEAATGADLDRFAAAAALGADGSGDCRLCGLASGDMVSARGFRVCDRCVGGAPARLEWPDRFVAQPQPVRHGSARITRRVSVRFLPEIERAAEVQGHRVVDSCVVLAGADATAGVEVRLRFAFEGDANEVRLRVTVIAPDATRRTVDRALAKARAAATRLASAAFDATFR